MSIMCIENVSSPTVVSVDVVENAVRNSVMKIISRQKNVRTGVLSALTESSMLYRFNYTFSSGHFTLILKKMLLYDRFFTLLRRIQFGISVVHNRNIGEFPGNPRTLDTHVRTLETALSR